MVLSMAFAILLAIAFRHFPLHTLLQNTLLWIRNLGPTGVVAFVVVYNLATLLFIPGSLLTLGGGVLYGVFWGSVYVVMAAILGATIAFLTGRYFARNWVSQQLQGHPRFQAIDAAVAREGLKIVLLTRLSPVFPFNLVNYAFGVTCVSVRDYTLGSLGIVPGTVMYVYLGALVGDIALLGMPQEMGLQARIFQWCIKIVGLIATVAVALSMTRIAKKALNQTVEPRS